MRYFAFKPFNIQEPELNDIASQIQLFYDSINSHKMHSHLMYDKAKTYIF